MERFHREAQLLAQLNHRNISSIYGVEQAAGTYALVMELVEGPTLADRLASGALSLEESLPIARQIAEALEVAHEKGIIHRDLKPANVKVRPDGTVKVLDFGLAKALTDNAASTTSAPEDSPTLTMAATQAGLILGTAAYMSPEQACGKPVDRRCDIWSFGVVLWEMLRGQKLFGGETISHTLADVLKMEIDFSELPAETPPAIARLLRRCLERNPKQRLRDIGEARIAIEEQLADPTGPSVLLEAPAIAPKALRRRVSTWVAGILAVALVVSLAAMWRITRPVEQPLMQFDVDLGPDATLYSLRGVSVILSPDGTRLVYVTRNSEGGTLLHTRQLGQPQAIALFGTEGARDPFFSPDGQWIGFFTGHKLKKISVEGGGAIDLCDASPNARGGSWSADGSIIVALRMRAGLFRVAATGGTPESVTELDREKGEIEHSWPQVLLGGKAVLFTSSTVSGSDDTDIEVQYLETGERKTLNRGGQYGRYLPSGHLVYVDENTLFAAPMDLDQLELTGPPAPLLKGVTSGSSGGAQFDFSQTGLLVYVSGGVGDTDSTVQWLDSAGQTQTLLAEPGNYTFPRFSPDGKRLALVANEGGNQDVWVYEWGRDTMSRLTFAPGVDHFPVWTPDGSHIAYSSTQGGGQTNIYWARADGASEPQRLTDSRNNPLPWSFSPDGRRLAFHDLSSETSWDIWTLPLEGDDPNSLQAGEAELFLSTPYVELHPAFSPDGRWLAYQSTESGTSEIYVRPFPGPGGKWMISNGGGYMPVWSLNGRELFYRTADSRIMVVTYRAKRDSFVANKPRLWTETQFRNTGLSLNFDLHPDGKCFAVLWAADEAGDEEARTRVTILLNFFDELRRRAPVE